MALAAAGGPRALQVVRLTDPAPGADGFAQAGTVKRG